MSKFKINGKLLDHIGLALYGRFEKAISELIANSYDANANEVHLNVDSSNTEIEIIDNGDGMNKNEIENKYLILGSDHRRKEERSSRRKPIGAKGIGKLAGIGIANRMMIITQKQGTECSFEINRDTLEGVNDINDVNIDVTEESDKTKFILEKQGTKVILTDFMEHVFFRSEDFLRNYLSEEFWISSGFNIFLNNKEIPLIPKIDGDNLKVRLENGKCQISGKYTGKIKNYEINIEFENDEYKILDKIDGELTLRRRFSYFPNPGIVSITRNRKIHEPSLFDIFDSSHQYLVIRTLRGYLRVECFDPETPSSRIDELGIQTDRSGYTQTNPKYGPYRNFVNDILLKIGKKLESIWSKERKIRLQNNKNTQKKKFKTQILNREEEVLNILADSLKNNYDTKKADGYLELAMKVFEKQVKPDELKKFFLESPDKFKSIVSAYIEIISKKHSILIADRDKYEELIDNSSTTETDMQNFLKDRYWFFGLDYMGTSCKSQPNFGLEKFDFLLKRFNNIYDIAEIKGPNDKILEEISSENVRDYKMAPKLNRSLIQVIEYFNFLEIGGSGIAEHYQIFESMGKFDKPRGIIVIGRKSFLDNNIKEKNYKTLCDRMHNIELLTYDDLLDRANNIIEFLNRIPVNEHQEQSEDTSN